MERAARLIKKHKYSQGILDPDEWARAVWPAAVGTAIARHTTRLKVVRETLVVGVEDAIWQKQLFRLSNQIVDRLQKFMGSTAISNVEFRIIPAKRHAGREESSPELWRKDASRTIDAEGTDEAEAIQDPMLRKVYLLSRKRSTA